MHYHLRVSSSGQVVLSRSSLRYLFFVLFLCAGTVSFISAYALKTGIIALAFPDFLSLVALGLIFASASFIVLMNHGSPKKIIVDGDGLILLHPGKSLRLWKEDIDRIDAVETMALPTELDTKKRLAAKKIEIRLKGGTAFSVYEGANEAYIRRYVARCEKALESGPSYRRQDARFRLGDDFYEKRLKEKGVIRTEEGLTSIKVPIKLDVPGFLMGAGMEAGVGIFLFGSLPGRLESTVMAISIVIWGIVSFSLVMAFLYALFGKQKLVIGPREIESRRRFLGIPFPSRRMKRSEASYVSLDLEVGRLSVVSKELKRLLAEARGTAAMGEKMGELLGGKAVKLDLSSLVWSERIAMQIAISKIVAEPVRNA